MSVTRALAGFVGLGIIIVGFGAGAAQLRRRFWPDAVAPTTWLVDATLGCAAIVVCGSVLGSLGLLHPAPLVATGVATGGSALAIARTARRRGTEDIARERAMPTPRLTVWAALATAAVVAIRWSTEVLQTLSRGFSQPDELHYHLTHSALFAQTGATWPIRFTSVGDGAAYHPANSELLHAIGLVVVGSDFVSIFLNLAFAALALCAGWVLGRRAGFPLCGTLIVATVLCTPVIANEAGSALNDTMAIAFLLAGAALLLEVRSGAEQNQRVQAFVIAIAGASTGVAAGTKLTVLVPAIALAVVASLSMERRWFAGATFVGTALLTGGYWFVRNLVHTGNPVPALSFGPLPGPDLEFQRSVEFPVIDSGASSDRSGRSCSSRSSSSRSWHSPRGPGSATCDGRCSLRRVLLLSSRTPSPRPLPQGRGARPCSSSSTCGTPSRASCCARWPVWPIPASPSDGRR